MFHKLLRSLLASASGFSLALALVTSTQAAEPQGPMDTENEALSSARQSQLAGYSNKAQSVSLGQITSVSQLSDVQPTDWAFQALQSLVERYGCIAGYPDGAYHGNRSLSRYEFAAGLNACLDRINELIAAGTADLVSKENLVALQRLQEEFAAELATLRGSVDALEARTAELEANRFSTTTKLAGQVVFGLSGVIAGEEVNGEDIDRNAVFGDRVRLELETSFTGEDLLYTRLATGNAANLLQESTPQGSLGFEQDEGHQIGLEVLLYQFPLGDRTEITVGPAGIATDDFTDTVSALDGDGASGAISAFGTRNSIYYPPEGAGLGVRHALNDEFEVSAGYLAADANDPSAGAGFFNGAYGAIAQLLVTPHDDLKFGVTYLRSYNLEIGTGSNRANPKTFIEDNYGDETSIASDAVGAAFSWRISDAVTLGGWGSYTKVDVLDGTFDEDNLGIWTWAATLAFPDILKEGNLAGIIVGMEPKVTNADNSDLEDRDTSFHVEGFFQLQLSDHVTLTPGIIWLTSPDHNDDNSDVVEGVLRTTFTF